MLSLMDEGICRYEGIELLVDFLWETASVDGTVLGTWLEGLLDDTAMEEDAADEAGSKLEPGNLLYGCSDKPFCFPL